MILKVLNNCIPHETIICDDKGNSRIKSLIENKNKFRKNYQWLKSNSHLLSKKTVTQKKTVKHFLLTK